MARGRSLTTQEPSGRHEGSAIARKHNRPPTGSGGREIIHSHQFIIFAVLVVPGFPLQSPTRCRINLQNLLWRLTSFTAPIPIMQLSWKTHYSMKVPVHFILLIVIGPRSSGQSLPSSLRSSAHLRSPGQEMINKSALHLATARAAIDTTLFSLPFLLRKRGRLQSLQYNISRPYIRSPSRILPPHIDGPRLVHCSSYSRQQSTSKSYAPDLDLDFDLQLVHAAYYR